MFVSTFVWGGAILGGGLSLSILLCPRKTKKNLYNLTWEIMKGYVQLEDFCLKKVKPTLLKDINLDDDGIFKITFFNCETQKYESVIDNIPKINSDWFFMLTHLLVILFFLFCLFLLISDNIFLFFPPCSYFFCSSQKSYLEGVISRKVPRKNDESVSNNVSSI